MPAAPTAAATLAEVPSWWITARCACRWTALSCRRLAELHGGDTTVAEVAARLLCARCRTRPFEMHLAERPEAGSPGFVGSASVRINLTPPEDASCA